MPSNNLKNIVVLKNLPSNLVDEAIVILKSNKTAKKLQTIENNIIRSYENNTHTNDYVIKEAESVIASYISKLEKNKLTKKSNINIEMKYKKIRAYSVIVSIILALCIIKVMI